MGDTMTDYFPLTVSDDQGYYSEEMADEVVPHGAAPPPNEPTKTKGMPNKMSLKLSHLPSKKDIKVVYPRTPSSVRVLCLSSVGHIHVLEKLPELCSTRTIRCLAFA